MIAYVGYSEGIGALRAKAWSRGRAAYVVAPALDKATLLGNFATALWFPAYFGHNLDALADCLRDLSWLPAGPKEIIWDRADSLRQAEPRTFAVVEDILRGAINPQLHATLLMR